MNVTIAGRVTHEGQLWNVFFEFPLPAGKSRAERAVIIHGTIDALSGIGVISSIGHPSTSGPSPSPMPIGTPLDPPMPQAAAMEAKPLCKIHREEMKVSNVQKEDGFTHYYCTKNGDGGYCRHRAKVSNENWLPTFWEVKE